MLSSFTNTLCMDQGGNGTKAITLIQKGISKKMTSTHYVSALLLLFSLFWVSLYFEPLYFIALGFTIYGLLYGFVHDGLVHRRWPFKYAPKNGYLYRLVLAHRIHHNTTTKKGAVSFGFLYAERISKLKSKLKDQ